MFLNGLSWPISYQGMVKTKRVRWMEQHCQSYIPCIHHPPFYRKLGYNEPEDLTFPLTFSQMIKFLTSPNSKHLQMTK